MEQILSPAILERLERTLLRVGAPAIRSAQPGLTTGEIDRLTAAIPGRLPMEAALWWRWRTWGQGGDMLPYTRYARLDDCMEHYEVQRQWAREHGVSALRPDVTPDDWWHPLWLPIFVVDGGMHLVVDISDSNATSAPIRRIDGQSFGDEHFAPVVAPTLGAYISEMLDAIDASDYFYNADQDFWTTVPPS